MLYGRLLETDYFRNYIPYAPTFEVEAFTAEPFVINMREWIMQGARDAENFSSPDPEVLSKVPVQRGWRMRVIVTEPPRHGVLEWNPNTAEFTYTSNLGYEGDDCFTYVFTNGYQRSLMSKVSITIARNYGVDINRIEKNEAGEYNIYLDPFIPGGRTTPLFIRYSWYQQGYKYAQTRDDGLTGIFAQDRLFFNTIYKNSPAGYPQTNPTIFDPNLRTGRDLTGYVPPTDANLQGYIENSDVPFRPTGETYPVYIYVQMYFTHKKRSVFDGYVNGRPTYRQVNDGLDFNKFTEITVRLNDVYGPKWYESGNITQI